MINIKNHPIWKGTPLWGTITPMKKRGHLLRFFLAKQYTKLFPRTQFIGITGSVGKTTTVSACKTVLSEKYPTLTTTANLDPIFNIPLTLLKIRPKNKKVILEMGIEYPGEMEYYLSLVKPATAIVTRVSYAHSEFLGSVEEITKEKSLLVEQLPKTGKAILNWDDLNVRKMGDKTKAEIIYYGTDSKNCHVWAGNLRIVDFQTVFELNYGVERIEITSKLLGFHQIYPLLAAASLGIIEDIPLTKVKKLLESVEMPAHRLQSIPGYNGSIILDDTHNSSPAALEEALETLNHIPARKRIVVLGAMLELGEFSEQMHKQIARKIFKDKIDLVFTGQGDAEYIAEELLHLGFSTDKLRKGMQNSEIATNLLKVLGKGDVALIKGSRAVRLDEVVSKVIKVRK